MSMSPLTVVLSHTGGRIVTILIQTKNSPNSATEPSKVDTPILKSLVKEQ